MDEKISRKIVRIFANKISRKIPKWVKNFKNLEQISKFGNSGLRKSDRIGIETWSAFLFAAVLFNISHQFQSMSQRRSETRSSSLCQNDLIFVQIRGKIAVKIFKLNLTLFSKKSVCKRTTKMVVASLFPAIKYDSRLKYFSNESRWGCNQQQD